MEMLIPELTGMNFIDFALCKLGNRHMAHELPTLQKVWQAVHLIRMDSVQRIWEQLVHESLLLVFVLDQHKLGTLMAVYLKLLILEYLKIIH